MLYTIGMYMFKLRRNITLESDLLLARLELEAFVDRVEDLPDTASAPPSFGSPPGLAAPKAFARPNGQQAYLAHAPLDLLPELIRRLSFVQMIYCAADHTTETKAFIQGLTDTLGPVIAYHFDQGRLMIWAMPHYALMELADVVSRRTKKTADIPANLNKLVDALLGRTDDSAAVRLAREALFAQATTSHLAHDLHYYKAKFFPRMARAMLNVCARRLDSEPLRVIDNFAGSGTTLLEASVLGMESLGLDIDPLSVLIARTKLAVMRQDSDDVVREVGLALDLLGALARGQRDLFAPPPPKLSPIQFPAWLLKNRKMTPEKAEHLAAEIALVQGVVALAGSPVRDLFRVLMSDAISRQVRMRFLGTGVGRFSLTFSRTPLPVTFSRSLSEYAKVVTACAWLRETLHLKLAPAQVIQVDARALPPDIGQFDILLTSPPYLPAASGRESYARARAPSLLALGMADAAHVDILADRSIGSMEEGEIDADLLSPAARDLVAWLKQDGLRAIKAEPTARYFLDMRRAFAQMRDVMRPGGLAVVVSGKQSTFYRFSTRDVLYVANTAQMLVEEALRAGFELLALYDMPLKKTNLNARPRSLDDYYETLIVLRKLLV